MLTIIAVGVSDDIAESIEELKELGDLPLSVQMVRVKNQETEQTNDTLTMLQECQPAFIESERTYIDVFNFHDFDGKPGEFEKELVRKIPLHV